MTWLLRERLLGWRQEIEGGERFAAAPVLVYPIKARSMLLLLEPALVLASTLAALGGGGIPYGAQPLRITGRMRRKKCIETKSGDHGSGA